MARKAAHVEGRIDRLPPEWREQFGRRVAAAMETLAMVGEVKQLDPGLEDECMDLLLMAFTHGKFGGNWTKVHSELATGAPGLYALIGAQIPKDEASPL